MRRLTTPTYFRWLTWVSRDLCRSGRVPGGGDAWLIDPRVQQLPLVQLWATRVRALKATLGDRNIKHGDVHERNIVFDVQGDARDRVFAAEARGDHKAAKRLLMQHIAKGPDGGADLVMIDFGQAARVGVLGRCCLRVCGDEQRFVDPDEGDDLSDATEAAGSLADSWESLYLGHAPTPAQRPKDGLAKLRYDIDVGLKSLAQKTAL